jgi:MoxR-like ATPase
MSTTTTRLAAERTIRDLVANLEQVVLGRSEAVRLLVVGFLAEGHVLLEDTPGTGKTTLAKALARSLDLEFRRVQGTSDLLPSDLLGVSTWSAGEERFVFRPGPLFGAVVLVDELNRISPRTQSALLECMEERRATVDGVTHELPRPFLVLATQNPLDFEGTYPLPESQLDRFLLRVTLGTPERAVEREIVRSRLLGDPLLTIAPVLRHAEVLAAFDLVRAVRVHEAVLEYALELVAATRASARLVAGASPRAALGLVRAAQAAAALEGRDFCVPDDVKGLALPVLVHRVVPVEGERGEAEEELAQILARTPVPA